MTTFTVIRHGETDFNRQQRWQGQVDPPLNALGHAQAERLAQRLQAEPPADVLLCSDLVRTRQTAAPLALAWGLEAQADAGFREQHFGVFDGLDIHTIKSRYAELWPLWLEHRGDFALPGGESLRQFHARVIDSFARRAREFGGAHVVVVTHGGVLDMLWRSARCESIEGLRACEIPNTGINVLRWEHADAPRLHIERWADAAHLQGLPPPAGTTAGDR